jgi:hypothetical protein
MIKILKCLRCGHDWQAEWKDSQRYVPNVNLPIGIKRNGRDKK